MRTLCAPFALAALFAASPSAFAQPALTEADLYRGIIQGPTATLYEGMPYTQRYALGMEAPQMFFAGAGSRRLIELDYADRFDRAVKFGYPLPDEPVYPAPRPRHPGGFGLGIFRR
ncbi:MAG: hypothetical protein K2X38_19590 [Gemmataceae bacterium]|nr:hypothetical protein [Gemmataceae bacterium]